MSHQPCLGALSAQARPNSASTYIGTVAPSHTRRPLPGGLARPTIALGCGVRETACRLGQLAAQLRPRLRREQHAEAGAEHRAGEQPDHETAAAAALILEPIVSVSHFRLLHLG